MQTPQFQSRSLYEERPGRRRSFEEQKKAQWQKESKTKIRQMCHGMAKTLLRMFTRKNKNGHRRMSLVKIAGSITMLGGVTIAVLWLTLPNINDPETLFAAQSTVIYDRNGIELYRLFSEQDRTYVPIEDISDNVKKATIAIEDERFFERGCFDVIGFSRAVISQFMPGFVRSGGSTLTQQFAKNALVGNQRTPLRKARELLLACKLEQRYDKQRMLELYLNWIPYGKNAYGVEQASRTYFGIKAKDLTLAQSAILAAIVQLPTYYNPYGQHVHTQVSESIRKKIETGKITGTNTIPKTEVIYGLIGQNIGTGSNVIYVGGRTDQVLQNMLNQHMISKEQKEAALLSLRTIEFKKARENIRAPHFVLWIQKQVESILGINDQILTSGGLKITTTLDWNMQQIAEKAVTNHRDDVLKRFGAHNAALMSVDPKTKEILAYVGNSDFNDEEHEGKIDMARASRQPGSSFKPIVYAAAFERGYGPGSVIFDVQTKFGDNTPENYGGDFMGLMTMRTALAGSRNIPAIKAFFLAGGEEKVLQMSQRLGIQEPVNQKKLIQKIQPTFDYGYPLAIGSAEVPLAEMMQAYATFADDGQFAPLVSILTIKDNQGNILPLAKPVPSKEVLDPRIAAQITSILSDNNAKPENSYWKNILSVPGFQAAAKTGTSNRCLEFTSDKKNCKVRHPGDTWTMGYTPSLVTGVWVGNATSQSLFDKADGLTTAAPIWHEFMVNALKTMKDAKTTFSLPSGMTQPLISRLSGQLPSECTPINLRQPDMFLQENTPTEADPACVMIRVDKVTRLLPSDSCPAQAVEEEAFFLPQSELPVSASATMKNDWQTGIDAWSAKQMERWNASPSHSGSQLPLPLAPVKQCDITTTPGRLKHPAIKILSPLSGTSVPYPSFHPSISIQSESAIIKVDYFLDDTLLLSLSSGPFDPTLRIPKAISPAGSHAFKVVVTDEYFNTASATAQISLNTEVNAPRISLVSPQDGIAIAQGRPITISAQSEGLVGIDRVEFYLDGTLLTIKRNTPYSFSYIIPHAGSHRIRVIAYDANKNTGSDEVSVEVEKTGTGTSALFLQ